MQQRDPWSENTNGNALRDELMALSANTNYVMYASVFFIQGDIIQRRDRDENCGTFEYYQAALLLN